MEVLAVIPARSGSKSVKDKNIRLINGRPMLTYSVEHALKSKLINRVIVSTDSDKYGELAKIAGAEVPFLRPVQYATDQALDFDVFYHCLTKLKEKENYLPDIVVQLRPTYPIRNIKDIDAMIQMQMNHMEADSVRSIVPAKEIPYKMWNMGEDGLITPLQKEIKECYNMPRQNLPKAFYQNACIDVLKSSTVLEKKSMSGDKILGYCMDHNYDIDTEEEFKWAEDYLNMIYGQKKFVFDIDGVIAEKEPALAYKNAKPNNRMIRVINQLFDYGNQIVLFTARGYVTGKDWTEVTKKQLANWGVQYHQLLFGKPDADYYIDDKMLSMERLYRLFDGL